MKTAALKKSIYSLPELMELLRAANRRYLEFISTLDDPSSALKDLEKIAVAVRDASVRCEVFNLLPRGFGFVPGSVRGSLTSPVSRTSTWLSG